MKKEFYNISNPTVDNINTGNVSVSINYLVKFDKDFLFKQKINDVDYEIILPKKWVINHVKFVRNRKEDPISKQEKNICFYLLKIEDILKDFVN